MIRDEPPGWTTTAHWCRSTSRTVADGTAAGSPAALERLQLAAGATGPYLPQAVIAALHATAPTWEQTDWATICAAYDRLLQIADSPVARANRALAIGFRDGFDAGLAALDDVADDPRLARSNTVAVDTGRPAAAGGPQRARRCAWYREGVGARRFRPGTGLPAPPHRRVLRLTRRVTSHRERACLHATRRETAYKSARSRCETRAR